jgi:hypothetical protein
MNEIKRFDTILVRRSNETKSRQGIVMSVEVENFAGLESVIASVDFGKKTELVNLTTSTVKLLWAYESLEVIA